MQVFVETRKYLQKMQVFVEMGKYLRCFIRVMGAGNREWGLRHDVRIGFLLKKSSVKRQLTSLLNYNILKI
jgi:hypothetical protein